MESTASQFHFVQILFSAAMQEVLVLTQDNVLQRWNVRDGGHKLVQEVNFQLDIKLVQLDDERFIVLVVSERLVQIRAWNLIDLLQEFELPMQEVDYIWDALYLPRHQFILAGGGHHPYYFIDLRSGVLTPAFEEGMEPNDFADFLACNADESLLVHSNTDQDHYFHIRSIDWPNLKLRFLHKFDGNLRYHCDVFVWHPTEEILFNVAINEVNTYGVTAESFHRLSKLRHLVLDRKEEVEDKRSGAQFFEDSLYVASGQLLAQFVDGRVQQQWELPAIAQDLAINRERRIAYVAMKSGFIGIAI
jgi:hypothetical protein